MASVQFTSARVGVGVNVGVAAPGRVVAPPVVGLVGVDVGGFGLGGFENPQLLEMSFKVNLLGTPFRY